MLDTVVQSIGAVLHPEDVMRVRAAFSLAITHVCFNETAFSHLPPRTIGTRLAHILMRLAHQHRKAEPAILSKKALAVLQDPHTKIGDEIAERSKSDHRQANRSASGDP